MFKSGKSIRIDGKSLKNKEGVLVAPRITVHGVVLSANSEIPKEVLEFFTSKGAKVDKFTEDGDKLVRLTGTFTILKADIQQLLAKDAGLKIEIDNSVLQKNPPHKPKVNLNSKIFSNSGGSLVSAKFNLLGIELDAEKPIQKGLSDFLKSKGVIVEYVESNGKKIKISGHFTLTQEEVLKFQQAQEKAIDSSDKKESKETKTEVIEAVNFQKQVQARLHTLFKPSAKFNIEHTFMLLEEGIFINELGLLVKGTKTIPFCSFTPSVFCAVEGPCGLKAGSSVGLGGSKIFTKGEVILDAGTTIKVEPECANNPSTNQVLSGMLSEVTSGTDTSITSKAGSNIENAVVLAGGNVDLISEQDIELAYDHDVRWINEPPIPSLIFSKTKPGSEKENTLSAGAALKSSSSSAKP